MKVFFLRTYIFKVIRRHCLVQKAAGYRKFLFILALIFSINGFTDHQGMVIEPHNNWSHVKLFHYKFMDQSLFDPYLKASYSASSKKYNFAKANSMLRYYYGQVGGLVCTTCSADHFDYKLFNRSLGLGVLLKRIELSIFISNFYQINQEESEINWLSLSFDDLYNHYNGVAFSVGYVF